VLTDAEVERSVATVDRWAPVGRRDDAVVLLAARHSLRPCDIRKLMLDYIDWRDRALIFRPAKTGRQLVLPLPSDVADGLSAYLPEGCPRSESRAIFAIGRRLI
jgi:integrase